MAVRRIYIITTLSLDKICYLVMFLWNFWVLQNSVYVFRNNSCLFCLSHYSRLFIPFRLPWHQRGHNYGARGYKGSNYYILIDLYLEMLGIIRDALMNLWNVEYKVYVIINNSCFVLLHSYASIILVLRFIRKRVASIWPEQLGRPWPASCLLAWYYF